MGKFTDETGNEYFYWTVISRAQSADTTAMWNCICRCGNTGVVSGTALRSGKSKSCGCFSSELAKSRRSSKLIGKKYNMLTVVDFGYQDKKHNLVWKCLCECGNTTYATSYELQSGHKKSCGCLQKYVAGHCNLKDLVGRRFTKLLVKERCGSTENGQALWLCQCDCGNSKITTTVSLLHGRTKSCGCLKSSGEQIIQAWLEENNIEFEREYRFEDCRYIEPLPFDFYIKSKNTCIEYDGVQHYKESRMYSERLNLEERQRNDSIKSNYCKNNNICLVRIPYWEKDNIESILSDWLFLNTETAGDEVEGQNSYCDDWRRDVCRGTASFPV